MFLFAREKWGKSSIFAHAPGAIFFMTRGETGLVELISAGRVPPTAHFPYDEQQPPTWTTLRQAVRELRDEEHAYRFLVVDTCNGAEILCQEHVRNSQFNGSQAKFASYGKGWDACRVEWLGFLQDLDALRAKRKMAIVLLAHTQVKKFDDPTAEESYDKYRPACTEKLWELTHKWSDIICFGHFEAETYETDSGKVKAKSDLKRVLCFDQSPLWEAGNRYGISGKLDVSGGAKQAFAKFAKLVGDAKAASTQPQPAANSKPATSAQPMTAQHPDTKEAVGTYVPPAATEGEQRADFPPPKTPEAKPATTPPTTTSSTTTPASKPSRVEVDNARARLAGMLTHEARVRVWESLSADVRSELADLEPKQAPAATEVDDGIQKAGKNIVAVIIEQLHKLGLTWGSVRDGLGKGAVLAQAAGLAKLPLDFRAADLSNVEALALKRELDAAVKEQEGRAQKRKKPEPQEA